MHSKAYGSCPVCVCVCVCLDYYSRATGYNATYEQYQKCQLCKRSKNIMVILLKWLHSSLRNWQSH